MITKNNNIMLNKKRNKYASLSGVSYLSLSLKSSMVSIYIHPFLFPLMLENKKSVLSFFKYKDF